LLAHNIGEIEFDAAWRAILLSAAASLLLLVVLYVISASRDRVSLSAGGDRLFLLWPCVRYVCGLHRGFLPSAATLVHPSLAGTVFILAWLPRSPGRVGLQTGLLARAWSWCFPVVQLAAYRVEQ
jgi:hypothetical protein